MTSTDDIARRIVDIAATHGTSDEAKTAMDHLLMDHGPQAVTEAGEQLLRDIKKG